MSAPAAPEDGDLVVRQEPRERGIAFVLHSAHGPDQSIVRTRDAAMAQARRFAKRLGVRVWFVDGNRTLLIEDFRDARRSAPSPAKRQTEKRNGQKNDKTAGGRRSA